MKANIILHYEEGTSDKVYISSIAQESSACFKVIGKWGRRGSRALKFQVKGTFSNEGSASSAQQELADEKKAEGYIDVESPDYDGPVRVNDPEIIANLEPELSQGKPLMNAILPKKGEALKISPFEEGRLENKRMIKGETEMICKDNTGMEDKFDKGVTYICEPHPTLKIMLYAYDKFGKKCEVFAERWKKVKA